MDRYEALKHAAKAHAGQVDKCGQPYILHPIAVAEGVEPYGSEDAVVLALLHDVLEDTDYTLSNVSPWQAAGLGLLTKLPSETYAEYIERLAMTRPSGEHLARHADALIVKLADLAHNLSPQRQDCLPAKERESLEKRYLKARDRIWEALGYRWWPEPLEGSGR